MLHRSWVEKIFQKLSLVYGRDFLSRWEGQDMNAVIEDWQHELAGYANSDGRAISYALDNLPPNQAPTVLQFRSLCRNAPQQTPKALPAPKADPAVVQAVAAGVKSIRSKGDRAWAESLKEREKNGTGLTAFQRQAWRTALGETTENTQ